MCGKLELELKKTDVYRKVAKGHEEDPWYRAVSFMLHGAVTHSRLDKGS